MIQLRQGHERNLKHSVSTFQCSLMKIYQLQIGLPLQCGQERSNLTGIKSAAVKGLGYQDILVLHFVNDVIMVIHSMTFVEWSPSPSHS